MDWRQHPGVARAVPTGSSLELCCCAFCAALLLCVLFWRLSLVTRCGAGTVLHFASQRLIVGASHRCCVMRTRADVDHSQGVRRGRRVNRAPQVLLSFWDAVHARNVSTLLREPVHLPYLGSQGACTSSRLAGTAQTLRWRQQRRKQLRMKSAFVTEPSYPCSLHVMLTASHCSAV